eukprot:scaffold8743_cov117-Skeletonema_marinoi.AAC.3
MLQHVEDNNNNNNTVSDGSNSSSTEKTKSYCGWTLGSCGQIYAKVDIMAASHIPESLHEVALDCSCHSKAFTCSLGL